MNNTSTGEIKFKNMLSQNVTLTMTQLPYHMQYNIAATTKDRHNRFTIDKNKS